MAENIPGPPTADPNVLEAIIAQRDRDLRSLAARLEAVEAAKESALISLRRADEYEFRGTNAEGGDAQALVRSAIRALSDPAPGDERVPDPNCPRCGGTGEVTDIDSWDPSNVYWCPQCCPRPDPAPGEPDWWKRLERRADQPQITSDPAPGDEQ